MRVCLNVSASSGPEPGPEPAIIPELAVASHSLDKKELRQVHHACELAKQVMKQGYSSFVHQVDHEPALQSCSADCTPITISEGVVVFVSQSHSQRRHGKCSHEFLVSVQFTRRLDSRGKELTHVMFRDPLPLTHGKKALQLIEGVRCQMRTLRQAGHKGLRNSRLCVRHMWSYRTRAAHQELPQTLGPELRSSWSQPRVLGAHGVHHCKGMCSPRRAERLSLELA